VGGQPIWRHVTLETRSARRRETAGFGLGINLGAVCTGAAISRGGHPQMVSLEESAVLLPTVPHRDVNPSLLSSRDQQPGRILPPVRALAETLREVLRTVQQLENEPPVRVALARPAGRPGDREPDFDLVARLAGLADVEIVSETESVVTYFAFRGHLKPGDLVAVYDLGGCSFTATVARYTESGVTVLGDSAILPGVSGEVFDDLLLAHVDQATGGSLNRLDPGEPTSATVLQRVREQCVRAKEALSRENEARVVVLLPEHHTEVRITRSQFESLIREKIKATVVALGEAIDSAGVASSDVAAVLLVGGSSRIPEIARAISAELGRPVLTDPHPQHCVTLGAAFVAGGMSVPAALAWSAGSRTGAPLADGPVSPVPPSRRSRTARPTRTVRKWGLRVIVALVALAVLGGIGAQLQRWRSGGSGRTEAGRALASRQPTAPTPGGSSPASPTSTTTTPPGPATSRPSSTTRTTLAGKTRSSTVAPARGTGMLVGPGAKCLDVQNRISEPGTPVQIFECNQTPAQMWSATGSTLRAMGLCLDSASAGGQLHIQTCDGSAGQKWQVRGSKVVNPSTALCLDVLGGSAADYTPAVSSTCRAGTRQTWKLT
jgi:molecular chaperone DnaK